MIKNSNNDYCCCFKSDKKIAVNYDVLVDIIAMTFTLYVFEY